jgi:hypothetical protein
MDKFGPRGMGKWLVMPNFGRSNFGHVRANTPFLAEGVILASLLSLTAQRESDMEIAGLASMSKIFAIVSGRSQSRAAERN